MATLLHPVREGGREGHPLSPFISSHIITLTITTITITIPLILHFFPHHHHHHPYYHLTTRMLAIPGLAGVALFAYQQFSGKEDSQVGREGRREGGRGAYAQGAKDGFLTLPPSLPPLSVGSALQHLAGYLGHGPSRRMEATQCHQGL